MSRSISTHLADGSGARPGAGVHLHRLLVAGALALVSLGLPWAAQAAPARSEVVYGHGWYNMGGPDGFVPMVVFFGPVEVEVSSAATRTLAGAQQPVRLIGVVAAILLFRAIRGARTRQAWAAVALGALALPLGMNSGLTSGRAAYAIALLLAATAVRLPPRPLPVPGRHRVAAGADGDTATGGPEDAPPGGPDAVRV